MIKQNIRVFLFTIYTVSQHFNISENNGLHYLVQVNLITVQTNPGSKQQHSQSTEGPAELKWTF